MSKISEAKKKYITCFLCDGWISPNDAITTTVKGQLENGRKFQSLVTVCWFCTLDVKQPLAVCLSSSSNLNANHKGRTIGDKAKAGVIQP